MGAVQTIGPLLITCFDKRLDKTVWGFQNDTTNLFTIRTPGGPFGEWHAGCGFCVLSGTQEIILLPHTDCVFCHVRGLPVDLVNVTNKLHLLLEYTKAMLCPPHVHIAGGVLQTDSGKIYWIEGPNLQ